jgi:uncharacterized membrane-anchored protein YhcB (DUF1043 family)
MGFEVWIVIVLVASGLSGWIGFAYANKDAPKQSDVDAMAAELEEARQQADSVQANVSEHFEQSAMLFGKLAADYREFLDHFESSAQNLGLSEARARELIEQGFQPLLTHQEAEGSVVAEAQAAAAETAAAEAAADAEPEPALEEPSTEDTEDKKESTAEVGEVTVELPDEGQALNEEAARKAAASESDEPLSPERQRA